MQRSRTIPDFNACTLGWDQGREDGGCDEERPGGGFPFRWVLRKGLT